MHKTLGPPPAPHRRLRAHRPAAAATFPVIALGLCTLLLGCGKSGVAGELAAFKDNGHAVSAFSDTDAGALGAKKCQTGTIDQMAALICEYSSSDSAALGQASAEGWVGEAATAVVLRRGNMLFAAADRSGADQLGKTISALGKVFRRIKK